MLEEANGPERDDTEKGGDSPAPGAEGGSACANFAADEAEEGGGDQSDQEHQEEDGLEDEDEGAGIPARIKRKEGAQAVVVGPVQQKVSEQSDERETVEQAPAYGGTGRLAGGGGGPTRAPAVEEPDSAGDDRGLKWEAEERVGPSAVMLEGSDGAVDGPEAVEVGGFGRDRHRDGGVGSLAVEPGAGEADSGHQVGYGVHSVRVVLSSRLSGSWFLVATADDELAAGYAV